MYRGILVQRHCSRRLHNTSIKLNNTTKFKETPRINAVGIQYLSKNLQKKIFPKSKSIKENKQLLEVSKQHLKQNGLLGKATQITEPIDIKGFPSLIGEGSLDEHFYKIGTKSSEPYLKMAESFLSKKMKLPPLPKKWLFQSGWVRYAPGCKPEPVPYPLENEIVFDVEVLYKISPYAVMNTAVTSKAWYGWVSPLLTEHAKDKNYNDYEHLIPFNCLNEEKIMIGYNVGYDRARVFDEYNIKQSKAFYLDAMALHVALTGICSQQRPKWFKHKKNKEILETDQDEGSKEAMSCEETGVDVAQELLDDPWLNKAAPNSLAVVAKHHCGIEMDKSDRDYFSSTSPQDIIDNFQKLMNYCAKDVEVTYSVAAKLFPEFRKKIPHPVSFAALRHLGTLFLPSTKKWDGYIETAERIYLANRDIVLDKLKFQVNNLVQHLQPDASNKKSISAPEWENDPWLSQLDWTHKEMKLKKDGTPAKRQAYLTGYPEWYRDLFKRQPADGQSSKTERELTVTIRTRSTPLFLRLSWEGYPLFWTDTHGWCFKVPFDDTIVEKLEKKNYTRVLLNDEDMEKYEHQLRNENGYYELFKVPHPDGPAHRCTGILGKSYLRYFEDGTMSSEFDFATDILKLNAQSSYWMGNRKRIKDQFIVYNDIKGEKNKIFDNPTEIESRPEMGIILPKICSMGTVTRRATENTWLTASNSKKSRIGSELKAMIEVPKGYAFVGADVDSEELWIASLIGDSEFKFHGATALGWMTLEGTKNEGTDLHSKTAEILGISRGDAKVFNYGRIYGAGVKFATRLLMQCNPLISNEQAAETAKTLYEKTKGSSGSSKLLERRMYYGGSESVMFNKLEAIAYEEFPRTPVLGASITAALTKTNLKANQFLTSRVNWSIQSSGVDYLHLLIVSMEHLSEKYNIPLRLSITVHDELRYLCKEEYKYDVALLLQISNLWTRAMFCQQLGINEVPQSCAFFSEVDIDHVLRKEVGMDCVTPSHPESIAPGESLGIEQLLQKFSETSGLKVDKNFKYDFDKIPYKPRIPVLQGMGKLSDGLDLTWAKMQCAESSSDWRKLLREYGSSKTKPKAKINRKKFKEEYEIGMDGDHLLEQYVAPAKEFASNAKKRRDVYDTIKPGGREIISPSLAVGMKRPSATPQRRYLSNCIPRQSFK
ncbi:DNA polymerase gamma [[Candida] anglica]|uniref:DNA-directed DNA polymerase n=1 Tax=[Candida] anglica TaxID=148631 RepID=A0ABP0EPH8_9ASCO